MHRLIRHLLGRAEDVRVVLREAAHAHQSMQRPARLIAAAGAELGHADRQLAIRAHALLEDLHMARAVHRLEREQLVLALDLDREHVLAVPIPMTRLLPEFVVHQERRLHLDIVVALELAPRIGLEGAVERVALGMPEHLARRFLLHVEEIELLAELAVVALLGLFEPQQIGIQLFLVAPGGAVDALKLRVLRIAAPIGAGDLGQLERVRDFRRGLEMRPAAEVVPVAVPVDRDLLAFGDALDQFGLVVLADPVEMRDGLVARPDFAARRQIGLDDLAHLLLDFGEVFGCERHVAREVVVEAVVDRGADGHLRAGVKRLHRHGEDMRRIVPDEFQRLGVLPGDDAELRVFLHGTEQVPLLAVHFGNEGRFRQTGTDGRRDFAGRGPARHRKRLTIR